MTGKFAQESLIIIILLCWLKINSKFTWWSTEFMPTASQVKLSRGIPSNFLKLIKEIFVFCRGHSHCTQFIPVNMTYIVHWTSLVMRPRFDPDMPLHISFAEFCLQYTVLFALFLFQFNLYLKFSAYVILSTNILPTLTIFIQ